MSKISSFLLICLLLTACAPGFPFAPATATSTPAPTFTETATASPAPTRTPRPSPTATATLTPLPIPTQDFTGPTLATANEATSCYSGPGNAYSLIVQLSTGESVPLIGKSFAYWIVQPDGMAQCWVDAALVTVSGATYSLPDFAIPPSISVPAAPGIPKRERGRCSFIDAKIGFDVEYILSWADNSTNEDGFYVYRDANKIAEVPANVTQLVDSFIIHSGGYLFQYYVVAYNSAGRSQGQSLWFHTPCFRPPWV